MGRMTLKNLVASGVLLALIGTVIVILAWPGRHPVLGTETGDPVGTAFGVLLVVAGAALVLTGIVGYGAKLGHSESERDRGTAS